MLYEHSGNPLLQSDAIQLNIYRFSDAGVDTERLLIAVTVAPPAYDVVLAGDEAGLSRLEVNISECCLYFNFRLKHFNIFCKVVAVCVKLLAS